MARVVPLRDALNLDKSRSVSRATPRETNFVKYTQIFRQLLLLNEKNDLATTLKNIQELLNFSENIFSSPAVAETFLYFCLHGAGTAWVLQTELNQPEATVYRTLKRLRAVGLIGPALKVSKVQSSKGGPRPTIWALDSASGDEIAAALKLDASTPEKGVDIQLATDMITHSYKNNYDTAVLVAGDNDFVGALQAVKDNGKHVEIALFGKESSSMPLRRVADKVISVNVRFMKGCWKN